MIPQLALRGTIWAAVIAWAASEVLRRGGPDRVAAARASYTAGAILLVAHTAAAFELRHDWSHAAALADTAARSAATTGIAAGAGLYLNYLFIAAWLADAAWWWMRPGGYPARRRGIDISMFLFFLFMFINGAVVFVAGSLRFAGASAIAAALIARLTPATPRLASEGA